MMTQLVLLWVQTCNVKQFLLLELQAPIVGTGMEKEIVKASGAVITAKRAGIVEYVSSEKIVVRADEDEFRNIEDWISQGIDIYHLENFNVQVIVLGFIIRLLLNVVMLLKQVIF